MPLKFLGGPDGTGSTLDAADAVAYAEANGARVINASWSGGGGNDILQHAIATRRTSRSSPPPATPVSTSTARPTTRPHGPQTAAGVTNILSVAAIDRYGALSVFSNGGSNYGAASIDVGAPGSAIYSTLPGDLRLVLGHVHGHPARRRRGRPRRQPAARPLGRRARRRCQGRRTAARRRSPASPRPAAWSTPPPPIAPYTTPGAPAHVAATAGYDHAVVSWDAPTTGGTPDSYERHGRSRDRCHRWDHPHRYRPDHHPRLHRADGRHRLHLHGHGDQRLRDRAGLGSLRPGHAGLTAPGAPTASS